MNVDYWKINEYDINKVHTTHYCVVFPKNVAFHPGKQFHINHHIDNGEVYYTFECYRGKDDSECLLQTDNKELIDVMCKHYGIINPLK